MNWEQHLQKQIEEYKQFLVHAFQEQQKFKEEHKRMDDPTGKLYDRKYHEWLLEWDIEVGNKVTDLRCRHIVESQTFISNIQKQEVERLNKILDSFEEKLQKRQELIDLLNKKQEQERQQGQEWTRG